MRHNYNIAGITVSMDYTYDEYLSNNIEAYRIDDVLPVNHTLTVHVTDHIEEPKGISSSQKNPFVIHKDHETIMYAKNSKHEVKELFIIRNNYQDVEIYINRTLNPNASEMEYVLLSINFMEIAMRHGYLPFHASSIVLDGVAILFSAPSQTGKSTHAKYWKQAFPSTRFINDDKPLLKIEDDQVMVYGSPFSGKDSINQNISAPLKAIVFLRQGTDNRMRQIHGDEALKELMRNMLRPSDDQVWDEMITVLNAVMEDIPLFTLDATHSIDAARIAHQMIFGGFK